MGDAGLKRPATPLFMRAWLPAGVATAPDAGGPCVECKARTAVR